MDARGVRSGEQYCAQFQRQRRRHRPAPPDTGSLLEAVKRTPLVPLPRQPISSCSCRRRTGKCHSSTARKATGKRFHFQTAIAPGVQRRIGLRLLPYLSTTEDLTFDLSLCLRSRHGNGSKVSKKSAGLHTRKLATGQLNFQVADCAGRSQEGRGDIADLPWRIITETHCPGTLIPAAERAGSEQFSSVLKTTGGPTSGRSPFTAFESTSHAQTSKKK